MYLSIEELGYGFIPEVFKSFFDGIWGHLAIYLAAVILIAVLGDKRARRLFVDPAVLLAGTVYNPLIMNFVIRLLKMEERYYRFLWLLPVAVTTAYALILICEKLKKKWIGAIVLVIVSVAIVVTGVPFAGAWQKRQNLLKISPDIVRMSDTLDQELTDDTLECAYLDQDLLMLRSYNAKIQNIFTRYQWVQWSIDPEDPEEVARVTRSRNTSYVLAMVLRYGIQVDEDILKNAVEENHVEYLIMREDPEQSDYFTGMGYQRIYADGVYAVYKTDLAQ